MKAHFLLVTMVLAALGQGLPGGRGGGPPGGEDPGLKLPNGKSQREELLKDDYKRNVQDARELAQLADELKTDIEKDDKYVVSVKTLKKTDDIERLAKRIRARLKRF
jgi:hypothetical protein